MSSLTPGNRAYMPHLDALRALAVIAVLVSHFWAANWGRLVPWGFLGVRLFFVLSGFLITGILLKSRDEVERSGATALGELGRFYARRFLRIFPLYYFVIGLVLLLGMPGVREDLGWLLSYTFNLHVVNDGWFHGADKSWYHNEYFHLWSLSVEEQFYLVWPWLVLLLPRRWVVRLIAAAVVGAIAYRYYEMVPRNGLKMDTLYMFTLTCLDTLGIGALLAVARHSLPAEKVARFMDRVVLPLGLLGVFASHYAAGFKATWALYHVSIDTTLALVCCWLIYRASVGFPGVVGRACENGVLRYLGKISYGIYVYHLFVPHVLDAVAKRFFGTSLPPMGPAQFVLCSAVTVAISAVSWHLFESPLNNLKRHFEAPWAAPAVKEPAALATAPVVALDK